MVATFWDGVLLELFNFKFLMIPPIMFSQFLVGTENNWKVIFIMAIALSALTMGGQIIWIAGADYMLNKASSERSARIQGYAFGGLLALVSLWLVIS